MLGAHGTGEVEQPLAPTVFEALEELGGLTAKIDDDEDLGLALDAPPAASPSPICP